MSLKIQFYTNQIYKGSIPEPVPAYKSYPKWFSELEIVDRRCPFRFINQDNKRDIEKVNGNVKGCPGIIEMLSAGYVINSWSNFLFREEEGHLYVNWIDSVVNNRIEFHYQDQVGNFFGEKDPYKNFIKMACPWTIKTDPGVSCLIMNPYWYNDTRFTTASAIYHSDVTPLNLKWFFTWNKKITTGMEIEGIDLDNQIVKKETPLIHIIPFHREKFESKINYVEEWEMDKLKKLEDSRNTESPRPQDTIYKKFMRTLGIRYR